ncbi:MAG: Uma2 family endonuclease [Gemmatimonadetes bacterium]|nr:Uma2 family endonuclease [Gemmatimonadota bacterium]
MVVRLLQGAFTVDDYYRLGELGVFHEDDRVELLGGQVVAMSPIGHRPAGCVRYLLNTLLRQIGDDVIVSCQDPLRLDRQSEPQPDLTLLKARGDSYRLRHPGPLDTLLVIEVADSSLEYDRDIKIPFYARAAIPEVWLVDLQNEHIEVYREPAGGTYTSVRSVSREETLTPLSLPHLTLKASDILI